MSLTGHRRWCRSSWWPDHLRNWGTSWSEKVSYVGLRKTDYDARRRDKLFVRCHGITFTSLAFPLAVTVSLIFARRGRRYMDRGQWEYYHCTYVSQLSLSLFMYDNPQSVIYSPDQTQTFCTSWVILEEKHLNLKTGKKLEPKNL